MVTAGILPFRENSHGRTGNRTRDLMISSQRLWPLDHEAGPMFWGRVQDYWLPTPLACFPFTSPPVRHRVPSGFNWALLTPSFERPIARLLSNALTLYDTCCHLKPADSSCPELVVLSSLQIVDLGKVPLSVNIWMCKLWTRMRNLTFRWLCASW